MAVEATTSDLEVSRADASGGDRGARETVLQPARGWVGVDWRELVEHRELLWYLVLRDVKVRYKQTVLGVAWAVLQPLLTTAIFTVVFGILAGIESDGVPYPIFAFAGQWAWSFFSNAVGQSGTSLVNQQHLLTKIYLPRLLVPTSCVVGGLLDMLIAGSVLVALLVWYGIWPGWGLVAVPFLMLLVAVAATGVGLVLSALTVSYRDFRHVIPFLLTCWMFLSPVVYPVTIVPERWRWALALNPMTGIIDGFRAALLRQPWNPASLAISAGIAAVVLLWGVLYFRRTERRFADVV